MPVSLAGRTAIVTGAGGGLGRTHALLLARAGATVIVNDVPQNIAQAEAVMDEIRSAGGQASAFGASVTNEDAVAEMVAKAGAVDILVNNAGILRDKSFAKMTLDEFRLVMDVHLMGSVICTKAVWDGMRERNYGRIVMTTSSSGLYGNFGQTNYGAAKMALVGFMQTLAIEGAKNNIRVNALAPTARTAMTENLLPPQALELLGPEYVSPALLALVDEEAPTRTILAAGAQGVEQAHITLTKGISIKGLDDLEAASVILQRLDEIGELSTATVPASGMEQGQVELGKALG
ncbi:NAD(P)-dependent dehydrogenase (short-subunit alcohol dehydrogenase family) [Sphingomonas kaistensis]|uniref:NAD(P)-dependent dehydrogenase (Short-subunit alcohol dehydrogenase family) n=1 Tax=Sphingomonas kaistensis TaxID=298708 RepID=A0A7X5Y3S4_9SPHN|nr:SDR family NAD(P)-dependent oxidoreductase [Sphingomonas kaistensis]NJC04633.1 NAD(P)-dependent dehydrogenase (short-subunit alcohol dehydrogenase family) [Sphingomonas kaistensis]